MLNVLIKRDPIIFLFLSGSFIFFSFLTNKFSALITLSFNLKDLKIFLIFFSSYFLNNPLLTNTKCIFLVFKCLDKAKARTVESTPPETAHIMLGSFSLIMDC